MLKKNHKINTVNIVHNDDVLVQENIGLKNIEEKKPVDADTLFRLGSITKVFQALTFLSVAHLDDHQEQIKKFGFSFNLGTKLHTIISKLHPKGENYAKDQQIAEYFKTISLYNVFTHTGKEPCFFF